jgi:hypothetical protein
LQNRSRLPPRRTIPDHGKLIATAQDMHVQLVFDLGEVSVEFPAQVDQQSVVRKLQQRFVNVFGFRRV